MNVTNCITEICRFIHEALQSPTSNVLVHCYLGRSRSVAAVAAYLMWAAHLSAADALFWIVQKRKVAKPNKGFRLQLDLWEHLDCSVMDPSSPSWLRGCLEQELYTVAKAEEGWISDTRSGEANIGALKDIVRPGGST